MNMFMYLNAFRNSFRSVVSPQRQFRQASVWRRAKQPDLLRCGDTAAEENAHAPAFRRPHRLHRTRARGACSPAPERFPVPTAFLSNRFVTDYIIVTDRG